MQRDKPLMTYNPKKIISINVELGERYSVLEKIGQGSFGDIYKVFDKQKNQLGAVKLERKDKKSPIGMLAKEAKILIELSKKDFFPKFIDSSSHNDYNYIIMQYLGQNLESIKRKQGGYMSLRCVLMIAIQMIQNLENLHSAHYIHRDIKPENFVIGTEGNHHCIYLIDFGLSKKYIDDNGQHIPFVENKGLVGTARYTSINSHLGSEQSRRDDMESLGYIILYFVKGFLPWQNFQCDTRNEKFRRILETKVATSLDDLCQGIPSAFKKYFEHVRNLEFSEQPNYEYLKNLFFKDLNDLYEIQKLSFDWCNNPCPNEQFPYIKKYQQLNQQNDILEGHQDNTDFTDIEERKNGELQIKLPYIAVDYPVRMSQMNQQMSQYSQFNNISASKLNQINPNTESKQVFYGDISQFNSSTSPIKKRQSFQNELSNNNLLNNSIQQSNIMQTSFMGQNSITNSQNIKFQKKNSSSGSMQVRQVQNTKMQKQPINYTEQSNECKEENEDMEHEQTPQQQDFHNQNVKFNNYQTANNRNSSNSNGNYYSKNLQVSQYQTQHQQQQQQQQQYSQQKNSNGQQSYNVYSGNKLNSNGNLN